MNQDFGFFKPTMPESRKADFYLGCLDSSVFLDFNSTTDKRIYLCRIFFDGFGCCNLDSNAKCLDDQLSKDFIEQITKDNLDHFVEYSLSLDVERSVHTSFKLNGSLQTSI